MWTRVFRGFLSLMGKAILSREQKQREIMNDQRFENLLHNESYEHYFLNKFRIKWKYPGPPSTLARR